MKHDDRSTLKAKYARAHDADEVARFLAVKYGASAPARRYFETFVKPSDQRVQNTTK